MPEKKTYRDYVIFFCLTAFVVAHFLLQSYPTTEFYLALMTLSLFCILFLKHYHRDQDFPFDFDENLTLGKWAWIGFVVIAIYGVSVFFSGISTPTGAFNPSVYIPTFGYNLKFLGSYQLPTYINDILFNITLVAPAEELCKLVSITAIWIYLGAYKLGKQTKYAISVGVPVSIWAILHVYSNVTYINNYWFVVSAFCSGLLLVVVLWQTKSVLAAILSHGLYNSLVIYLINAGLLVLP